MRDKIEGPLADWVARLEALALKMRADPRVNVTFYLAEPIGDEALAKIEARWKVDAFAPAIRNLYRQANGVCLLWVSTHHSFYPRVKDHWKATRFSLGSFGSGRKRFADMPTTHQVDGFAGYTWEGPGAPPDGSPPWGAIYLPPFEKVAGAESFVRATFGGVRADLERAVAGKTWRGDAFEKALRVFDYPWDYSPAAMVMEPGVSDPPVVLADDHSAWDQGRYATFEGYMGHVLGTFGTPQGRRDWFRGDPGEAVAAPKSVTLDEVLPASVELVAAADDATFEVRVVGVEGDGGGEDPRIAALRSTIPSYCVKNVAKVLGLKPYNRKGEEFLPEIAAATADPKAINSKIAGKLMAAANQRKKTKGAYLEAFAVGLGGAAGGGGEKLSLEVETCFDRSSLNADEVDASFKSDSKVESWLGELGIDDVDGIVLGREVKASGRKVRTARITLTLARASGLEVGKVVRSTVVPAWYVPVGDAIVRRII